MHWQATRNRLTQPSTTGKLCLSFLTSCATSHIPIMCASSVQHMFTPTTTASARMGLTVCGKHSVHSTHMPCTSKRLVSVTDDRLAHFDDACACDPPQLRCQKNYSLPPACARAINIMFQKGPNLGAWRAKQARNLSGIARKARELDKVLKACFSPPTSVQHLQRDVRDVNIVLLCLMCDTLNHQDVNLPRNFLLGFPVTGVVPDSGVLRPIPTAGTEEAFWTRYKRTMTTNNSWATTLDSAVNIEGLSARGRRRELLRRSLKMRSPKVSPVNQ